MQNKHCDDRTLSQMSMTLDTNECASESLSSFINSKKKNQQLRSTSAAINETQLKIMSLDVIMYGSISMRSHLCSLRLSYRVNCHMWGAPVRALRNQGYTLFAAFVIDKARIIRYFL